MEREHSSPMYRGPRLFVESKLTSGQAINLHREQARYLLTVMRRSTGSSVRVFNGMDGEWSATLVQTGRDKASLNLEQKIRVQVVTDGPWLAFAMIKRSPTELIVEKATELGVSVLQPVRTSRSNSDRLNCQRLSRIAIEAAEQSERMDAPQIKEPTSLSELLSNWPKDRLLIVGDETGASPPICDALKGKAGTSYGLLIGPEGGFTSDELNGFNKISFVQKISLGPRVLRAETAAIVSLALAQATIGDFDTIRGNEG